MFASVGAYVIFSSKASSLAADFNNDNAVNVLDLSILASNWGRSNVTPATGDANNDSVVNILDLSLLAGQWGQSVATTPTPTPTPSPTFTCQPINCINIKTDYGVVDNPTADASTTSSNTTKLNSALTAAKNQAKSIWVPNGTFVINRVTVPNDLTIYGENMSTAVLKGNFNFGSNTNYNNLKLVLNGVKDGDYTTITDLHDINFSYVDFEGKSSHYGDWDGLVFIQGSTYNVNFYYCIIGSNQDGVGNGVKVVDTGRHIHHILFDHCTIKYQPRMGIEVIGRASPVEGGTGGKSYEHVDITNSYFEASAGEAISYDDNYSENANRAGSATEVGNILIKGNHIEGSGVGNTYEYGQVIENNGVRGVKWENNYFGAGRDGIVNIQGRSNNTLMNMVAIGNTYDSSHIAQGITNTNNQIFMIHDIPGGVSFSDEIIFNYSTYGMWAWMQNVNGINFGGSTIRGFNGTVSSIYGGNNTNIIWPIKN